MRVAILDDYQSIARRYLGKIEGVELVTFGLEEHTVDEDILIERLRKFEVIVAMRERTPFPASLLARLRPTLKLLITTGASNASIDVAAARQLGIKLAGTGSVAGSTAELTWALLLAVIRRIPEEHRSVRQGGWQTTVGFDLEGKTIGLVGLGRLGKRVAKVALAFGMKVLACSENLTADAAKESGAELATSLMDLCQRSDILSIHTRLSARTRGLIGKAELEALGPRGFLVNTSRGPIVQESALIDALDSGTIAGAGLDVCDIEPLPTDHVRPLAPRLTQQPLRTAPRTVLTPHIGYGTDATYSQFYIDIRQQLEAWIKDQSILVEVR